jgi:hypothetical protein
LQAGRLGTLLSVQKTLGVDKQRFARSHIALNAYINKRGLQPPIKKVGLDSCDFAKKLS